MLKKQELQTICGGGVNLYVLGGILVGVFTFLGGVLDGLSRPLSCHK